MNMGRTGLCGNVKGSALVIAVLLALLVAFLMTVGGQLIATSNTESHTQQKVLTEADNVARAGLVDAIAWFKRQSQQPVRSGYPPTYYTYADGAFYPRVSTDTTKNATIDESIGLVKEYQLSEDSKKWARYEVRRQPDTASNAYDSHSVHDISGLRIYGKNNGEGLVWYIESAGYVYMKNDTSKAYNEAPNKVVAHVRSSTEIRRLALSLPLEAAVLTKSGGSSYSRTVTLNKNGRIMAGHYTGVGYVSGSSPKVNSGGSITGSTQYKSGIDDPTVSYVLGVSTSELKMLADYVVTDTSLLPSDMPDMALIFINGDASFTSSRPLSGGGILFVNGNLNIAADSNAVYSGLIYATGTVTISDPALISGTVIAYGGLTLSRSAATDIAEIDYDPTILSSVRQQICQYRENKSALHVFIGVPGLEN